MGYHRAIERLLERCHEVLLRIHGNVDTATLFGEAFCIQHALLARPRVGLVAKTDDVNGEPIGGIVELFGKVARRPTARLFAVVTTTITPGLLR